jgi:hypothetical protein
LSRYAAPGAGARANCAGERQPSEASDPPRSLKPEDAGGFGAFMTTGTLALAVFFVVLSQIKINVVNAYSGSLSWSTFSLGCSITTRDASCGSSSTSASR